MELLAKEDINRMSDKEIFNNPHIYSRKLSKWADFLTSEDVMIFEKRYGYILDKLGYSRFYAE
jgi:hypothetical protein